MKAKLKNVSQGHADVEVGGQIIGFVEYSNSARQWWGYDKDEKRIGNWPNPRRDHAVQDVVKAAQPE